MIVAEYLAQRTDLARFDDVTVIAMAGTPAATRVLRHCVEKRRSAVLEAVLDAFETDSAKYSRPADVLRELAIARGMEHAFYQRVLTAASAARSASMVLAALAENVDVPWELLAEFPVSRETASAVGRALQERFTDEPGVWMLAAKLMENTTTVREVIAVLEATYPEHVSERVAANRS